MYLILCWSYLNHSLRFVGEKKRIKKNRILNRNRNILVKKSQLDYFPKSFSPSLNLICRMQGQRYPHTCPCCLTHKYTHTQCLTYTHTHTPPPTHTHEQWRFIMELSPRSYTHLSML